jgi:Holliday junction resolvase
MEVELKIISNIHLVFRKELIEKIINISENAQTLPILCNQFGKESLGKASFYNQDNGKKEEKHTTIYESWFFKLESYNNNLAVYQEVYLSKKDEGQTLLKLW